MRGRKKIERNLATRPLFTKFGVVGNLQKETITLTHDELEAIKLADLDDRYHEECAKELDVSRSTFSRIIKSARHKVALMLLFGKTLEVAVEDKPFTLAYPSNDRITIAKKAILATYFVVCEVESGEIKKMSFINNPVVENLKKSGLVPTEDHDGKNLEAGRILPPLFEGVNIALFLEIGDGLKRNLEGVGVSVVVTKEADAAKAIKEL